MRIHPFFFRAFLSFPLFFGLFFVGFEGTGSGEGQGLASAVPGGGIFAALTASSASAAKASPPSKEDYENLRAEWLEAKEEEESLAESCPSDSKSRTQPVCALNLVEIRALQEDREKKLTRMEKSLDLKTSFKDSRRARQAKEENENPAKKTTESAVGKINKQKKFLKITALINAGVGGYLLLNHCSPPAQKVGCVLGPLALGQALISHNQAGKLQTAASQLSGINFPSDEKEAEKLDSSADKELEVNGQPIAETKFPCEAIGAGQGQCRLSPDGTKVQPVNGGEAVGIGELAGMTRIDDPAERKAAKTALRKALKTQKPLLAKAKELEADYDPVHTLSGGSVPALSSPSLSGATSGSSGGGAGKRAAASYSGASPPSKSGAYGFAPALSATEGGEGEFYDEWAEEEEEESPEESEDSIDKEIENILGRFGAGGEAEAKKSKEEKPVAFGKSERVAPASGNIFSIIKRRYQSYRKQRELVGKTRSSR